MFLGKRCLEIMQQIYRRAPMLKCDLEEIEIETALQHGCSPVNLLHIFRIPIPKSTSGRLLLRMDAFLRYQKWLKLFQALKGMIV